MGFAVALYVDRRFRPRAEAAHPYMDIELGGLRTRMPALPVTFAGRKAGYTSAMRHVFLGLSLLVFLYSADAHAERYWFTKGKTVVVSNDVYDAVFKENDFCDPGLGSYAPMFVYLRFKTDDVEVGDTPAYKSWVEDEVAGATHEICGELDLQVFNFFSTRFDVQGREYEPDEELEDRELPASMVLVKNGEMGKFTYFDHLKSKNWEPGGDDTLTTAEAIRRWLGAQPGKVAAAQK
jgi:hypothetical protein